MNDIVMPYKSSNLFPAAFIDWAGSMRGGVRKPFNNNSGRPTGEKIVTPLTNRLDQWVSELVNNIKENTPKAILLVGGPGNGKTDAVEACVERLDEEINAKGELVKRFTSKYIVGDGKLPPRKSVVNFSDIYNFSSNLKSEIHLVQDATEKDVMRSSYTPEALLNEELNNLLLGEYQGIYICCINRGILANASSLAHKEKNTNLIKLINELVQSASGGPNSPDCWPIKNTSIAIWPMDVESLVAPKADGSATVMHQILNKALSKELWKPTCANSVVCPFCQNKELLFDKATQNNLVQLLHFYELCSGKRWTFRDLYSLISYLFVGEKEDFVIGKKLYEPCEWTAKQLEIIDKGIESLAFSKAPYLLAGKLYHHRLFSLWPKFTKGKHREVKLSVLKNKPDSKADIEGYYNLSNHFRALQNLNNNESNSISKLLVDSFSPYLDPALISGDVVFFESKINNIKVKVTANLIDERFGLSISDGFKLVKLRITEIEKRILKALIIADEYLMEHNHSPLLSNQVRYLQASIRQYSSRLVKRCLGVKYGLCQNSLELVDYSNIHFDKNQVKKTITLVRELINENKSFLIPLSTTFGQPVAHRERQISLLVSEIKPKMHKPYQGIAKPIEHLPYIEIHKGRYLPVTFSLFKSLKEVEKGLNEASLPEEIFAMLDKVKSIVAGEIVRDKNYLDSTVNLKIGSREFEIEVDDLVFDGEI